MAQDWDIRNRADACAKSGRPFTDGERYVSRLVFGSEGYAREDYAEGEWHDELREGALSIWRSVYRLPPPPPEEALKKETAESMLRQLMELDEPANGNAIYILAVMLERRRILVERDVQRRDDGTKVRIYEHRKTGESFLIPDPELRLTELEAIQDEVVVMLGGRRPGTTAAPSDAAPGTDAPAESPTAPQAS